MNMVPGRGAAAALGGGAMRVPQAPQKANPIWTGRPQLGQGISPAEGAAMGACGPVVGLGEVGAPKLPPVARAGAGPASGLGGS
jgi:hypothetical protein